MKMTFIISDTHKIAINQNDNGTITADSMHHVSGELWSHSYKDFASVEDAITFYQIAF